MNKQEQQGLLDEHIPYRLQEVDGLRWACEMLASKSSPTSVDLCFNDGKVLRIPSIRFLTNPMVEVGAIYCRVLLEFLGLSLNRTKNGLEEKCKYYPDGIRMQDFELRPLTLNQAYQAPAGTPVEIEQACVNTILTAHKAVAHLTLGPSPRPDFESLHRCSIVVPWLICEYLYKLLNLPDPEYRLGEPAFAPGLSPLK